MCVYVTKWKILTCNGLPEMPSVLPIKTEWTNLCKSRLKPYSWLDSVQYLLLYWGWWTSVVRNIGYKDDRGRMHSTLGHIILLSMLKLQNPIFILRAFSVGTRTGDMKNIKKHFLSCWWLSQASTYGLIMLLTRTVKGSSHTLAGIWHLGADRDFWMLNARLYIFLERAWREGLV